MTQTEQPFEVVGTYFHTYEAHLALGQLEAEGIAAWLVEDHPVRMREIGMLGGAKVAVHPQDADAARSVLRADHSSDLDALPESEFSTSFTEQCPRCARPLGSELRRRTAPGLLGRISARLGFAGRSRYATLECPGCRHVWVADTAAGPITPR